MDHYDFPIMNNYVISKMMKIDRGEHGDDKRVCRECLLDRGLKKFFDGEPPYNKCLAECSFCKKSQTTISACVLTGYLRTFILADRKMASLLSPGSKTEENFEDTRDILEYYATGSNNLFADKVWDFLCLQDDLFQLHWDLKDLTYVEIPPASRWLYAWENLKYEIRHKNRFLIAKAEYPAQDEDGIASPYVFLRSYLMTAFQRMDAIRELDAGTTIYRARLTKKPISDLCFAALTSVPDESAKHPNRFSPAGISMFYGADSEKLAKLETGYDEECSDFLYMSQFELKQNIHILDLTKLAYTKPDDVFDPDWISEYYIFEFIKSFSVDIARPCTKEDDKHMDYLATQFICEYIKLFGHTLQTNPNPILGIKYCSSHYTNIPPCDCEPSGKCCYVLFCNHQESGNFLHLKFAKESWQGALLRTAPND